jgi:hypothetical protein
MSQAASGVCPGCDSLISAPDLSRLTTETSAAFSENPLHPSRSPLSLPDYLVALREECRALARRHEVDPDESFPTSFGNRQDAFDQHREVRNALPEIPDYRYRNVLPSGALASMMLGALIAIPAGMAIELLVSLPAAAVIAFAANTLQNYTGGGMIVVAVAMLLAFIAPFLVGSWACASIVTKMGRRRKNRNRWVAAILASVAAGVAVLLLWAAHLKFGSEPFRVWDPFKMRQNLEAFTSLFFAVNFLIAVVSGGWFAAGMVRELRFCEECQEFTNPLVSKNVHAGAVKAMLLAIASGSVPMVASLMAEEDGQDGILSVYRCPVCGGGIVELAVSIVTMDKNSHYRRTTWYVASVDLKKQDVEWFRPIGR